MLIIKFLYKIVFKIMVKNTKNHYLSKNLMGGGTNYLDNIMRGGNLAYKIQRTEKLLDSFNATNNGVIYTSQKIIKSIDTPPHTYINDNITAVNLKDKTDDEVELDEDVNALKRYIEHLESLESGRKQGGTRQKTNILKIKLE